MGEPSEAIRQRVDAARKIQQARFEGKGLTCNADMGVTELREFCGVDGAGRSLLQVAMQQLGMSARSYRRILSLPKGTSSIWSSEGPRPLFLPPRLLQGADPDAHGSDRLEACPAHHHSAVRPSTCTAPISVARARHGLWSSTGEHSPASGRRMADWRDVGVTPSPIPAHPDYPGSDPLVANTRG